MTRAELASRLAGSCGRVQTRTWSSWSRSIGQRKGGLRVSCIEAGGPRLQAGLRLGRMVWRGWVGRGRVPVGSMHGGHWQGGSAHA